MLMLDMGLGKTAVALQALTDEHLPALVAAPKRVAELAWPAEAAKWRPDLTVAVAVGRPQQRLAALDSDADIVALGIDNLGDARVGRWRTLVFDESSLLKSAATKRWKLAKGLAPHSENVWLLSGTPAPNGLLDLWSQIYLLDQGERLGSRITIYRDRYFRPSGWIAGGKVVRYEPLDGAQAAITAAISDIVISMRAGDWLDLPPETHVDHKIDMPASARANYDDMRRKMVAQLSEVDIAAANAAVVTGKLSQITAGAIIDSVDGRVHHLHGAKVDAVAEIAASTDGPLLVFTRFRFEREALVRHLGAATINDSDAIPRWCAGEIPILAAHPASAGHGLNLQTGGHTIAWTTPTWSSEQWRQANARLARQGQIHPVIVHRIVAPQTVDGIMLGVVGGKIRTEDAIRRALGI